MAIELVIALALVAANGFFVAVEFSIVRLRPTQIEKLLRERRPGAKSAAHAVAHLDAYLSACQLGITMSSLGLGAIGEPAFHELLEPLLGDDARIASFGLAAVVAFLIITTLHVVVGELSPKSLAIARTTSVALALAPPMRAFYYVTRPLVDTFNFMGNVLLKPFGVPPPSEAGSEPHSEDELRALLRESSREGLIEAEEQQMSEAALLFGDLRAREVMKPRGEIDYVLTTHSPRQIADRAMATGRTRLPACEPDGGLDAPVGVINVKDLLPLAFGGHGDKDERLGVDALLRPLAHVSEAARVDEVLRDMRGNRVHVALVHDEHGTVVGLLTMEDILEQLVGEIDDEFDPYQEELFVEAGDMLVVDGHAPMRALAERIGMELPPHHETTVGGWLSELLGRVPEPGERIELDGHRVEVLETDETRITKVTIRPSPPPPAG